MLPRVEWNVTREVPPLRVLEKEKLQPMRRKHRLGTSGGCCFFAVQIVGKLIANGSQKGKPHFATRFLYYRHTEVLSHRRLATPLVLFMAQDAPDLKFQILASGFSLKNVRADSIESATSVVLPAFCG